MIKVNSKEVDPVFYDSEFHMQEVFNLKTVINDAHGDKEMLKRIHDRMVVDENGYFLCLELLGEPMPRMEDFTEKEEE